ncbi:MFS transporter [Kribbella sp. NPDC056951]|uniref:MFS transporter n=1 Tax=Kribbella sp. NPDC056951 TaxID=3345978 RepID=UPI0036327BBC
MSAVPAGSPVRTGAVVPVLASAGITVALMQTLVIPVIPELPRLLNASAGATAWAITATLLAAAVATPIMGRLGDMYGKRRMLLISIGLLVAGSIVAALSSSLVPLIVGRALQGFAAGVIPLGISIMRDELPSDRLGTATAQMSASLGVGGALGLPAAALLAENISWHALFWVSAGLGVIILGLVLRFVPESSVRSGGRFDVLGGVGLSFGLISLLLAISQGADWGWTSAPTLGLFAVAVVTILAWGWWERRTSEPLVDLRTTARPQVLLTNLASMVFGFAMFAMSLVVPQLLQMPKATGFGLGQSMLASGLVMGPSGLVMLLTAPLSAKISAARGPKATLMLGAIVVAAGYGVGSILMGSVWEIVLVSLLIGAGIGLAYGAMPALIMSAVPVSETAAANSFNTLMRSIGTSVSSAVAGVILANLTINLGTHTLPSQTGFRTVLIIGAAAALVALAIAACIPTRSPTPTPPATPASAEAPATA